MGTPENGQDYEFRYSRSTPGLAQNSHSVLRDVGFPSGGTALEHARMRFAIRLMRTVNATHLLPLRLYSVPDAPQQRATKLRLLNAMISHAPQPVPSPLSSHQGAETTPPE
ncbi:hypothetical protein EAE99_000644 [Botrytis elliptica]|nr:hypothetical protein EAE99_000644 [Botrytis elliptica]